MAITSVLVPLWALFAVIYGPAPTAAVTISYCSSENTGFSFSPQSSIFQSNGLCQQTCSADYVFAIILGEQCWCSNYVPAETTSVSDCDSPCPGYPSDTCGNTDKNLFGYIHLSSRVPSGTTSAPGVQSTQSSAPTTTSASSDSTTAPTTTAPPTTTPIVSVQTVAGQPVTITVLDPGSTSTPTAASHSDSSLSGGAIAGIVIGSLFGVGALVALGIWLWFFTRRRDPRTAASPDLQNTLLDNRRQSKASQMSLMRNFFSPSDQEKSSGSPDYVSPAPAATFTDSRMKKDAVLYPHGSRHSTISLRDDQDYSRPVLRLTNPD
ncbi:hypothetical protein VTN77DRAFT_2802 [Rasamsonia byssochlamydoides]|uniref:uncharacterized protein n=1 Tax=Rasamsonia byssochlamydoides TaxID=89139 RepID=UPI0037433E33